MKYLLPLLILINCGAIQGVLEWTVIGKVTDYGQNVTLFCNVSNCCPQQSGWDRWTPHQRTLFIDVKTGRPNKKYDGKVMGNGYTLVIQNLTKADLNVSYSCLYGVTLGDRKFLLEEDVFIDQSTRPPKVPTGKRKLSGGGIASIIAGVAALASVPLFIYVWRRRKKRKKEKDLEKESENLIHKPSAPEGPVAISNITESSVDISWKPPRKDGGAPVDEYQIEYRIANTESWQLAGNVDSTIYKFSVRDLKECHEYYFKVTAINSKGPGSPIESAYLVKLIAKPSAPEGPMAISNITESSIEVAWKPPRNDGGAPVDGYQIEYRIANTHLWKQAGSVDSTTYKFSVRDLTEGQEYYFKVTAINIKGPGSPLESVDMVKLIEIPSLEERTTIIDAIHLGTELRKHIRIQVIGKNGVGKTSLVRRLLYNSLDVKSTDGIEIDRTCQIRTSDGNWIVDKDKTEMEKLRMRILQAVDMKQEDKPTFSDQQRLSKGRVIKTEKTTLSLKRNHQEDNVLLAADLSKGDQISTDKFDPTFQSTINEPELMNQFAENVHDDSNNKSHENKTKETDQRNIQNPEQINPEQTYDNFQNTNSENSEKANKLSELMVNKMDDILLYVKNKKEKLTLDHLVECGIWDFAGQKEYYATHQTFFTRYAIYLLVVDMDIDIEATQDDAQFKFETSGDYIDFWLDSIHCFRGDKSYDDLRPPVIIVCTNIDKIPDKDKQAKTTEYSNKFTDKFGRQEKGGHIRGNIHFISNTTSPDTHFDILKQHISDIANEMQYFSERLPTKWIELENALAVYKDLKGKLYCVELNSIEKIAKLISIEKEELLRFLNYQHTIGNIIFFEDKPDYIILQSSWLVDCFKCLVCDDEKYHGATQRELYDLKHLGVLSENLIRKLFEKRPELLFREYGKHILDVMQKFDIILKTKFTDLYYMPCMINDPSSLEDIKKELKVKDMDCTPWLVLEFNFFPISFYNHILFSFIRTYNVWQTEKEHPAIYTGKAVFRLDNTNCRLLCICFSRNVISLQIWKLGDIDDITYKTILKDICNKIEELEISLKNNLHYEIKAKCSIGDYSKSSDRLTYEQLNKGTKYRCREEHDCNRSKEDLVNTWLKHAPVIEQEMKERKKKLFEKEREDIQMNVPEEAWNQAQIPALPRHDVILSREFKIDCFEIVDCAKVGNRLVFTGKSPDARLIICEEDGTVVHFMSLDYRPLYVTEVDSNTVAVSCTLDRTILIIDVSTCFITSSIKTSDVCDGIAYANNCLYVVIEGSTIQEMDIIGSIKRTIRLPVHSITSINVIGNKVVCIDAMTTFCFSLDGELIWKISRQDYKDLHRITTDDDGNVYVTDGHTRTVAAIADNGTRFRKILDESNELVFPYSLHFDKTERKLMVCSHYYGKVLLFNTRIW